MYLETQIYRTTNDIEREIQLLIEYDYQPGERQEIDYPGCDEGVEITRVMANGVDFELTTDEEDELEKECLESLRADY